MSLQLREMYTEVMRRLDEANLAAEVRSNIVGTMEQLRQDLISSGIVQPL